MSKPSKQAAAKAAQNYDPKPVPRQCNTCVSFIIERVTEKTTWGHEWTKEKNLRCGIGGFAVKKTGACDLHTFKPKEG